MKEAGWRTLVIQSTTVLPIDRVQKLSLTQFQKIRFIRGEPFDISLFSDEVLFI